jgi:hypothetical protein
MIAKGWAGRAGVCGKIVRETGFVQPVSQPLS